MKIRPLGDQIVVKALEAEEKTKSGIFIPDSAKDKPQEATVKAVGPGKLNDDGKRVAPDVKIGDVVLYSKYGGTEFKLDGEELLILREEDILAVVEK